MKFICAKENLEYAAHIAERFTGKNINLPILSNILLEVNNNNLTLTATNLEHAVELTVSGRGSQAGKISVPAKILSSLVQSFKDSKVECEGKHNNLWVKTETRDTKINGLPPDDFPLIPKIKKSVSLWLEPLALRRALEQVTPAVSASEFKPELTGVYFQTSGQTLRLAATDTFRLAEKVVELGKKVGESVSFILPQRMALELARFLEDGDDVKLSVGENQVLVETDSARMISRLLEGSFPDYSGIIPKSFELTAFIKRGELMDAIRAATIFSSKLQDVTLNFRGQTLELTAVNPEVGEYKTSLPVASSGKDVKLSFNHRYLLDGINVLDEEEIFIGCTAESSPVLLRNKNDSTFTYVVMPIRLG